MANLSPPFLRGTLSKYNADGSVDSTVVSGASGQSSVAVDETRGLVYSSGYYSVSTSNFHKPPESL